MLYLWYTVVFYVLAYHELNVLNDYKMYTRFVFYLQTANSDLVLLTYQL